VKVVKPSYIIERCPEGEEVLAWLERCCRVAYKSEDKIAPGSAERLIRSVLSRGHESVIEHDFISVRFICDRGVTHELVRHRLAAYTQESTRYCNYSGEVTFIRPLFWKLDDTHLYKVWFQSMEQAEINYRDLIGLGASPQEARGVLPNSLKTEIIATANIREWRHILALRTAKVAHPQMRELMIPLLQELKTRIPLLFDDIKEE